MGAEKSTLIGKVHVVIVGNQVLVSGKDDGFSMAEACYLTT